MSVKERIHAAETRITKLVFPQDANPLGTLYGGNALHWMDEVAFLTATRFSRRQIVTVSMDRVDFQVPIPTGSIVEIIGRVVRVGNTSLTVEVDIYCEDPHTGDQQKAISGTLVMVAVDEDMQPVKVMG